MDIEAIIPTMTLEDKIALCTGADFWCSKEMKQYGIPSFKMSDGPHGLRCQAEGADMLGINDSLPATCFPAAVTAGATWNTELFAEEGKVIGEEACAAGVAVVLGPGCNIKRNPLCGRNFEYLSEDPYLAGKMAAAFIKGQQSTGTASSLKHFAANNQEYKRMNGDSQIDDRALREIYLAAFEEAVKSAKPKTVMCSYNKINGIHASDNKWLLTEVLREEWKFEGMVVTDWGALNDRRKGFIAGCDLNMPGGSKFMEQATMEAVKKGELKEEYIDASVRRILTLAMDTKNNSLIIAGNKTLDETENDFTRKEHDELACVIAEQGAVLMKNERHILPINPKEIVLIGDMAEHFRYQGAGSSHINPTQITTIRDMFPEVPYAACCDRDGVIDDAGLAQASHIAQTARVAVVIAGLPESYESEGFDRDTMAMPEGQNRMIEAVAEANPNTVVVLLGGSVMELPWYDKVKAIVYMGLSGQAGGRAVARVLTGEVNPSGKLTETWPISYHDVVCKDTFGKKNTEYRESIYVGYRYYDKAKVDVRFPFGHGLSYTEFTYSNLEIEGRTVKATIQNAGTVAGAEVVQLYISPPKDGIHRPNQELKGFERIELASGESREVSFELDDRSFAIWKKDWIVPSGEYDIYLGSSCRDLRLKGKILIEGEILQIPEWQKGSWYESMNNTPSRKEWESVMGYPVLETPEPRKGEYTMDNSCFEMKEHSLVMKIQYKITEAIIAKGFGGTKDYNNPSFKMMLTSAVDCPLRATIINAGGILTDSIANGLLEMANGHYIRGMKAMLKK
jgi:beta-glucosidase